MYSRQAILCLLIGPAQCMLFLLHLPSTFFVLWLTLPSKGSIGEVEVLQLDPLNNTISTILWVTKIPNKHWVSSTSYPSLNDRLVLLTLDSELVYWTAPTDLAHRAQ